MIVAQTLRLLKSRYVVWEPQNHGGHISKCAAPLLCRHHYIFFALASVDITKALQEYVGCSQQARRKQRYEVCKLARDIVSHHSSKPLFDDRRSPWLIEIDDENFPMEFYVGKYNIRESLALSIKETVCEQPRESESSYDRGRLSSCSLWKYLCPVFRMLRRYYFLRSRGSKTLQTTHSRTIKPWVISRLTFSASA